MKAATPIAKTDFAHASLAEQVRLAKPLARRLITEGIEYHERLDDTFIEVVGQLLEDEDLQQCVADWSERELSQWTARFDAARAIGIAIGLMLRPDAFEGGAR